MLEFHGRVLGGERIKPCERGEGWGGGRERKGEGERREFFDRFGQGRNRCRRARSWGSLGGLLSVARGLRRQLRRKQGRSLKCVLDCRMVPGRDSHRVGVVIHPLARHSRGRARSSTPNLSFQTMPLHLRREIEWNAGKSGSRRGIANLDRGRGSLLPWVSNGEKVSDFFPFISEFGLGPQDDKVLFNGKG
jgi:hypothetical protein